MCAFKTIFFFTVLFWLHLTNYLLYVIVKHFVFIIISSLTHKPFLDVFFKFYKIVGTIFYLCPLD